MSIEAKVATGTPGGGHVSGGLIIELGKVRPVVWFRTRHSLRRPSLRQWKPEVSMQYPRALVLSSTENPRSDQIWSKEQLVFDLANILLHKPPYHRVCCSVSRRIPSFYCRPNFPRRRSAAPTLVPLLSTHFQDSTIPRGQLVFEGFRGLVVG